MKADKTISIRVSNEELKTIDEYAKSRGINRSAYIIDCALKGGTNTLNIRELLNNLSCSSNIVNNMRVGDVITKDLKNDMREGLMNLWQCLKY